jgi:hypothetical protein
MEWYRGHRSITIRSAASLPPSPSAQDKPGSLVELDLAGD